jgi:hypothetical protein
MSSAEYLLGNEEVGSRREVSAAKKSRWAGKHLWRRHRRHKAWWLPLKI